MVSTLRKIPEHFIQILSLDKTHTKGRRDWKVRHREHPSFGDLDPCFRQTEGFVALWCFPAETS